MNRLISSSDFQRISRAGKKFTLPAFVMLVCAREEASLPFRVGYTVSRKVGNAVVRNRAKRRLREVVRLADIPDGIDIVLIARTASADRDFEALRRDFAQGLEKLR